MMIDRLNLYSYRDYALEQETEPLPKYKIAIQVNLIVSNKKSANIIKKMPLPPPKNLTAYGTYLYFAEPDTFETFMRDCRQILMDNFQKVRIEDGGEY
jgi:hypothetical protein